MQTIKRNIFSVLVLGLAGVMAVNTSGHSVWGRARVVSVCTVGWPGSHALRTLACGLPILVPLVLGSLTDSERGCVSWHISLLRVVLVALLLCAPFSVLLNLWNTCVLPGCPWPRIPSCLGRDWIDARR